jgi:hypothetical protein
MNINKGGARVEEKLLEVDGFASAFLKVQPLAPCVALQQEFEILGSFLPFLQKRLPCAV